MNHFLSCDWGTSSFRLRLAAANPLKIIQEVTSAEGISQTFTAWSATGHSGSEARIAFYLAIIQKYIVALEKKANMPLASLPILLSGMASSTIGLLNLPYQTLPFALDASGCKTQLIFPRPDFNHEVLIISGVQSDTDVMRGEETQLIGCIPDQSANEAAIYILPGTHSKHIRVANGHITAFKTYMTGEIFDLLAHQSILNNSVQKPAFPSAASAFFREGVQAATKSNFLHAAFLVRTNNLLEKLDKTENFDYLSGLLIGTELQDLQNTSGKIYLLAENPLQLYYQAALTELGLEVNVHCFPEQLAGEAAIRGQLKIYKQIKDNA